jgi:hypothetical protein
LRILRGPCHIVCFARSAYGKYSEQADGLAGLPSLLHIPDSGLPTDRLLNLPREGSQNHIQLRGRETPLRRAFTFTLSQPRDRHCSRFHSPHMFAALTRGCQAILILAFPTLPRLCITNFTPLGHRSRYVGAGRAVLCELSWPYQRPRVLPTYALTATSPPPSLPEQNPHPSRRYHLSTGRPRRQQRSDCMRERAGAPSAASPSSRLQQPNTCTSPYATPRE